MNFSVIWNEDSTATVLGRVAASGGSGAATGVDGEGNWLEQVDISTITAKVFDLDSDTPNTPTVEPTVTITQTIMAIPVTNNLVWTADTIGYNFSHVLPPSTFPLGNRRYRIEYKITLTDGLVFHGSYEGATRPLRGS